VARKVDLSFSTLEAIRQALACQPGDLLRFEPDRPEGERAASASKKSAAR
jgi:DNA-binding Xre family transcriptional regulator